MADLVRVRLNGVEKNMGRALAEVSGVEILDEDVRRGDGRLRGATRKGGRRVKPKVSVAEKAAEKKAAVIEPAPIDKEQNR